MVASRWALLGMIILIVVTFVALLDLLKAGRIRVDQSKIYGEIWLEGREPAPGAHDAPQEAKGDE